MPGKENAASGLIRQLLTEGYRFEFFQAVRLLELWAPERSPVGRDAPPQNEAVRFGALPSVEFPASQIFDVTADRESPKPPTMTVTFFGLTGPLGALPQHYTEAVIERLARKDRALLEFLNLFNHRLLSLFYRAWEKYQFWICSERALVRELRVADEEERRAFVLNERPNLDPLGQILVDLCGLGTPATRYVVSQRDRLEPRTEISDQTWRFYAGILSQRRRSASSLEGMLTDHFGLSVRVHPLCGRWLQLEAADQTRLKRGCNSALGLETVAGRKVWEAQGKFRLRLGPLKYAQFCSMLPTHSAHRALVQLTRFYVGQHLDFDLDLRLLTSEIPELRCGDKKGMGPRLGWNTWLKTNRFEEETASVVLRSYDDGSID